SDRKGWVQLPQVACAGVNRQIASCPVRRVRGLVVSNGNLPAHIGLFQTQAQPAECKKTFPSTGAVLQMGCKAERGGFALAGVRGIGLDRQVGNIKLGSYGEVRGRLQGAPGSNDQAVAVGIVAKHGPACVLIATGTKYQGVALPVGA